MADYLQQWERVAAITKQQQEQQQMQMQQMQQMQVKLQEQQQEQVKHQEKQQEQQRQLTFLESFQAHPERQVAVDIACGVRAEKSKANETEVHIS